VVDTFDAMTSDRPYRKALTLDQVRAEIERCTGSQFDPEVVKAFFTVEPSTWEGIRRSVHENMVALAEEVHRVVHQEG
jgi:HD-GYP domain-containing protein (c-di-GMP phosphodiesterase class II)